MYLFICISSYVVHAFFISSYVSFLQKDNAPISTIAYNFNPVASTQFWVRNQELLRTEEIIKTYRFKRACSCSLPPTGPLLCHGTTICACLGSSTNALGPSAKHHLLRRALS